ncbi:MAG: hypothetical protein JNN00_10135 [Chitinophagaceae bacterium]|nr:hypothetical protein [Chitinophagaceae bacterium]
MNTFSTIITANYFPKALALFRSLQQFDEKVKLQVLVADNNEVSGSYTIPEAISLVLASRLSGYSLVNDLYKKYAHYDMDSFRWSLKPLFASWLLENGFEKVFYIDCDMFFVNDYRFLFTDLDHSSVLLTPNWTNSDPLKDKDSFFSLFTSGLFSAGFFGVNKKALPALHWWAQACHFMMGEHIQHGIRADQKYLDVFPVKFEDTCIIRHRGCNIGAWNIEESKRELVNGEVLINGKFPVIFIHFDDMMVKGILRGHDKLLLPYLERYQKVFEESGARLSEFIKAAGTHTDPGMIKKIKWKLKLKTRIKQFLYKLSQKI